MPLFSIVTVTLNREADAVRTAQSVLEQDCADYEYIVKDGASSDRTVGRLNAMGVGRVVSGPDDGVYHAMNEALALCRGRYVCFMNAGDTFASATVLSAVAERIQSGPDVDFFFGDVFTLSPHPDLRVSDRHATFRRLHYPNRLSRFWLWRRVICHQAWFVRKAVYDRLGGFDVRYQISAAYDFQLRLLLDGKAPYEHLPFPIAIYQAGGLSDSGDPRQQWERRAILQERFPTPERLLYQATYAMTRGAVRKGFFRLVYPVLPKQVQDRVFGV